MNAVEGRSHYSIWAIASAPLVLSFDLSNTALLDKLWPIVAAPEVLQINAATAGGHPGTLIAQSSTRPANATWKKQTLTSQWQLWAKPLGASKGVAVLAVNFDGSINVTVPINLALLPLQWWGDAEVMESAMPPRTVRARDVWVGRELGSRSARTFDWRVEIAPHDCKLFVLRT
jgi:hypothetical protein